MALPGENQQKMVIPGFTEFMPLVVTFSFQ